MPADNIMVNRLTNMCCDFTFLSKGYYFARIVGGAVWGVVLCGINRWIIPKNRRRKLTLNLCKINHL